MATTEAPLLDTFVEWLKKAGVFIVLFAGLIFILGSILGLNFSAGFNFAL